MIICRLVITVIIFNPQSISRMAWVVIVGVGGVKDDLLGEEQVDQVVSCDQTCNKSLVLITNHNSVKSSPNRNDNWMANMKTIVAKSRLGNVNVGKLVMILLSGVSDIVQCYVMGVNVSTESLSCGRE